jgi:ATP/maltotriose-dependent transcriptional regulator MalT
VPEKMKVVSFSIFKGGTGKTHLKHVYSKLAVQSRTQAVARARPMGLL